MINTDNGTYTVAKLWVQKGHQLFDWLCQLSEQQPDSLCGKQNTPHNHSPLSVLHTEQAL